MLSTKNNNTITALCCECVFARLLERQMVHFCARSLAQSVALVAVSRDLVRNNNSQQNRIERAFSERGSVSGFLQLC